MVQQSTKEVNKKTILVKRNIVTNHCSFTFCMFFLSFYFYDGFKFKRIKLRKIIGSKFILQPGKHCKEVKGDEQTYLLLLLLWDLSCKNKRRDEEQ